MIGGKINLIYTEPCLAPWAEVWALIMYLLSSSAKEEAKGTIESPVYPLDTVAI